MKMPCLFCGSADELKRCPCGEDVFMNLNDLDYAFFVNCYTCGREASATGKSPNENHDEAVRKWNADEVGYWQPDQVGEGR